MPELKQINLALINEPPQPLREAMDEARMAELAESLRTTGQIYPIAVVPDDLRFEIVDGHRRFLAARELRWESISCLVFPNADVAREAVMLHSNIIREDVTVAEEAVYFAELMESHGNDVDAVADLVHRSYEYVSERLRLFQGRQPVFEALRKREINFAQARALNRFKRDDLARYWLEMTKIYGTPSRSLEDEVRKERPAGDVAAIPPEPPAAVLPATTTEGLQVECWFCGGNRDPYNLKLVYMHVHCRQWVEKLKERAAEGQTE